MFCSGSTVEACIPRSDINYSENGGEMDSELENMSTDDDLNNTVTLAKDNDNMYLDLKRADSSITIVLLEESNQKMNS